MAKLLKLPEQAIIDGLSGVLDFYVIHLNPTLDKGIPVCRSWPRYKPETRTAASADASRYFAYANKMAAFMPESIKAAYANTLAGSRLTWKDMMVRMYLKGENV